jgi:hypothetical protein
MKNIFFYFLILFSFFFCQKANSQTFQAKAIIGLTASQIDGDFEVGYNKIGLTGGFGIGINLGKRYYLGTEFLYSQRGSKNALLDVDSLPNGQIHLDYVSLPIVFRLMDWYQEEKGYNKVWLEVGIAPGNLVNAKITGNEDENLVNQFSTVDFSGLIGAGYNITDKYGFSIRYTRSFFPFYVAENPEPLQVKKLISYFITLRFTYTLL